MWGTPVGAEFRDWMDMWDVQCEANDRQNQIKTLVDGQNFVLFFKRKNDIFGAHEPHRVTFARMKNPDDDVDDGWLKEASFMAVNLSSAISGSPQQEVFQSKNIDDIKVIDKDAAHDALSKQAGDISPKSIKQGAKAVSSITQQQDDDPNIKDPGMPIHQGEE